MKRLVNIDLPRRLSRRLPRPLTELLVGGGIAASFVLLRAVLAPMPDELAPFALSFVAIVLATLVGGWRSGLVALVLGQALIWFFLLPDHRSFRLASPAIGYGLLLTTATQFVILFALGLYQREVRAGQVERTRRINFLGHALREIDHRTKNNFQIVTSLLTLQGSRSANPEVQSALREASERLMAVAAVYDALAPSSHGLAAVRLQDQLQEICSQIRRGILPDAIRLETGFEPILVPNDTAVAIGIIVNELVTNACKHAFAEGGGTIRVRAVREGTDARIEVADDGRGMPQGKPGKGGLGTRLVAAFVQRLGGTSEVRSDAGGTVHSILVPLRP